MTQTVKRRDGSEARFYYHVATLGRAAAFGAAAVHRASCKVADAVSTADGPAKW